MSFHFIVRFDPQPVDVDAFRKELLGVIDSSLQEPGCIQMEAFESVRHPILFYIHSEWIDEAAFDVHATLPHTFDLYQRQNGCSGIQSEAFGYVGLATGLNACGFADVKPLACTNTFNLEADRIWRKVLPAFSENPLGQSHHIRLPVNLVSQTQWHGVCLGMNNRTG